MTLKDAIKILLDAARRDMVGAGCGMKSIPSPDEIERIRVAMLRAGKYAYGDWYTIPGVG